MKKALRLAAACIALGSILACGGGGGGSDAGAGTNNPPPAAVDPTAPVDLSKSSRDSMAEITSAVPREGEVLLALGRYVADLMTGYSSALATANTHKFCIDAAGSVVMTLDDRDGNERLSTGDLVDAVITRCSAALTSDEISGSLRVELLPGSDPDSGLVNALVTIPDGLRYVGTSSFLTQQQPRRLQGSFILEWRHTSSGKLVRVRSSAADDLRAELTYPSKTYATALRQVDVQKEILYEDARNKITLRFAYESEYLGGRVRVETPETILSYLDTTPDAGSIEVFGASDTKYVLKPLLGIAPWTTSNSFGVDLVEGASRRVVGSVLWSKATRGFLWFAEFLRAPPPSLPFPIDPFNPTFIKQVLELPLVYVRPTDTSLRILFSRDVSRAKPMYFRLQGFDSRTGARDLVDLDVTRQSALWTLHPSRRLQPETNYSLELSRDGVTYAQGASIDDSNGTHLLYLSPSNLNFVTESALRPRIDANGTSILYPSESLTLSGARSASDTAPVAGYRWSQVSGTPLSFSAANSATTELRWGASAPTGFETIPIRLTVTDGSGASRSIDHDVVVANPTGAPRVLYLRSVPGNSEGQGKTFVYSAPGNDFTVMNYGLAGNVVEAKFNDGSSGAGFTSWALTLWAAGQVPLAVGSYEATVDTYVIKPLQNTLNFRFVGTGCQPSGGFKVLEIEVAASGELTRLAVDFDQACFESNVPLLGSLRINSAIPLRR